MNTRRVMPAWAKVRARSCARSRGRAAAGLIFLLSVGGSASASIVRAIDYVSPDSLPPSFTLCTPVNGGNPGRKYAFDPLDEYKTKIDEVVDDIGENRVRIKFSDYLTYEAVEFLASANFELFEERKTKVQYVCGRSSKS
ncbi:MAG: hypothetical protein HYY28_08300 [Betaproteobacteria bacterium]|nr:hypothetical protein [Betaproteobacteria bacterium]